MKIMVINGPNLNLLGIREPDVYGKETYASLCDYIRENAVARGHEVLCVQDNAEGKLIDYIHTAYFEHYDGIIINPAAYTHYSYAILDALKGVGIPAIEVHLSDITQREAFRKISVTAAACIGQVYGKGRKGYLEAMDILETIHEKDI